MSIVPCTFVSVFYGGLELETHAMFNPDTGIVSDVQFDASHEIMNPQNVLCRELIRVNGNEYEVRRNDDGTCSAVRTFEVFFSRSGYAKVQATSELEAFRIADEKLKSYDISWDDDWHPTDVQLEE